MIAILLVRPAAMVLSLLRMSLSCGERLTIAWVRPKGCASVVYGLLVLHSSTDVPVAKALRGEPPDHLPSGRVEA